MSNPLDDRKKALEEDYFRRKDQEAIEKMRARMDAQQQAQEVEAARLKCPKCDGTLVETNFENVMVDRCDKCNGIWLGAGELESITRQESGGWLGRLWSSEKKG
jgi:ribosomal protein L37AE/L43A